MVLRVDKEKGYIDLSKRRVAAEDIQVRHSEFKRQAFNSIVQASFVSMCRQAPADHYDRHMNLMHCLCLTHSYT